ncbi:melanoma-associated antigen B5-like [Pteronotus mesoamericanus]|uniref:melanoma-associated antigen B5-like n=1 Tax=Pteronotus mesoamericanus TaxID=1884717 RepID=UPI0023EC923C|nr:melanoma-associated antigen B5-like [Pteronotus parnellii mesoamericanus]
MSTTRTRGTTHPPQSVHFKYRSLLGLWKPGIGVSSPLLLPNLLTVVPAIITPRHQESKRRVCHKGQQVRDQFESPRIIQEPAKVEAPRFSSTSVVELDIKWLSGIEATSTPQASRGPLNRAVAFSGAVDTAREKSRDEDHSCSSEDSSCSSEDSLSDYSGSDSLSTIVKKLQGFLLYKLKMKQRILKEDILKIVTRKYQDQFADILKKASDIIETVFAVELKEKDSARPSYVLVSNLKLPNNGRVHPGRGFPKTGLLMSILAMIFLNENRATGREIWDFLNSMQVYAGRNHFIFGEPRKLITRDFVRLKYLEYRQAPASYPGCYAYVWGRKACTKMTMIKVLRFLARVSFGMPNAFSSEYEALREEEERKNAHQRGPEGGQ